MDALDSSDSLPVLVVGAGVAGLTAALDLAALGVPVHLVEREGWLGGQVVRLDKLYPSDHCGFCPVWTDAAACLAHPLITLHRHTSLEDLAEEDGRIIAFCVLRMNDEDEGEMFLGGIHPDYQGQGIYHSFLCKGMDWCLANSAKKMIISTQLKNISVQKVLIKLGFEICRGYYTYHKWFD